MANLDGLTQGEVLAALRYDKGLSRGQLGKIIYGVEDKKKAASYVQNRETGHTVLTDNEIDAFAAFFGVDRGTFDRAAKPMRRTRAGRREPAKLETPKEEATAKQKRFPAERIKELEQENLELLDKLITATDKVDELTKEVERLKGENEKLKEEAKDYTPADKVIKLIEENTKMKQALVKVAMEKLEVEA